MTKQKIKIPKGWEEVRLKEVCDFINGKTPLRTNNEFWENGTIPWFTIEDMRLQGKIINKTNQHITEKAVKNTGIKIVPKNTVLLCCTASIGEYAFTKIDITTNQQFNALVVKDFKKIMPEFLFSITPLFKKELEALMGSTTFGFVSLEKLGSIKIPLPPLSEQQKIAEILSKVDDKIKINKQIKSKLIQLKKGLMGDLLSGEVRVKI